MPPSDRDPQDDQCPKCGATMEPIDSQVQGLVLNHLQLCPACYLVVWQDQNGFQMRQGVPSKGSILKLIDGTDS